MIILGIDPGIATTGYGVVDYSHGRARAGDYGCILTDKAERPSARLQQLHHHATSLLQSVRPDVVVIEKLFFNTNITTAMTVGQARGVIMLAIEQQDLPTAEYTPLQVKMAVCGYGRAKKPQVQQMMATLLQLPEPPRPDDAADALAIALCHASALLSLKAALAATS
jgi:crossover junction endodeoxyribonuclease RuvC